MREARGEFKHLTVPLEDTFFAFLNRLTGYLEGARRRGLLRADTDPLITASLLYLAFSGLIQVDTMAERHLGFSLRDPTMRRAIVQRCLAIVMHGVAA
jgi:hypothetical protein